MKPRWRRRVVVVVSALLLGCGARVVSDGEGGDDSSTHWLSQCRSDADCGALECLCGVCSKGCDADEVCEDLGNGAVCDASCGGESAVCTRECETDDDCPSGSCSGNVCRLALSSDPGSEPDLAPSSPLTPAPSVIPGPGRNPSVVVPDPVGPSVEQLCNGLDGYLGSEFEIDLSGEVVERQASTAIACDAPDGGGPVCCNWTWTAYVLPCPEFDIVLTGTSEPYGVGTTPADQTFDDDLGSVEVTLGCQGMDCAPTCTPASVGEIGRVRARLEPAVDGEVLPGDGFEPFLAEAALDVVEAL